MQEDGRWDGDSDNEEGDQDDGDGDEVVVVRELYYGEVEVVAESAAAM